MLQYDELQAAVTTMVKGKADIVLYGNKSSGKTYLAKKVLDTVLGSNNYAYVKSLFVSNRESLLYLVGDQIFRLLNQFSSVYFMDKNKSDQNKPKFIKQDFNQSLTTWIRSLNKFIENFINVFSKIGRLYIFIDNIQQISLSQVFMKQFYYAMKTQVKHIKISFFFCGMCHKSTMYNIYQPFKSISQFFMPRPDMRKVVRTAIQQSDLYYKSLESKQFQKLLKHIENTLYNSFQSTQFQTEYSYLMAKCFLDQVNQRVGTDKIKAKNWIQKGEDEQTKLLQKLRSRGPVTLERTNQQETKKLVGFDQVGEGEATFYKQNYPNLIMSSLGLANGFPQTQDIKRFVDMRRTKSSRSKNKMTTKNATNPFKQDLKKLRHTKQRIVGISEVLEQQSKSDRLKQKQLPHHTLDYYGCFEYLRQEGCINFFGKGTSKFGGTIVGQTKQSEVKDFFAKLSLQYFQFTGKN